MAVIRLFVVVAAGNLLGAAHAVATGAWWLFPFHVAGVGCGFAWFRLHGETAARHRHPTGRN